LHGHYTRYRTSLRGPLPKSLSDKERAPNLGRFNVAGRELHGHITVDGTNSSLFLHDTQPFSADSPNNCITGTLHDLTKVTLLDCLVTQGGGSTGYGKECYFIARIFPHFILHGDRHISTTEKSITEIAFSMQDASALFNDFTAFGYVVDGRHLMQQIASAYPDPAIKVGPHPEIFYFNGMREVFSVETAIGRISGSHNLSFRFPGPDGIHVDNTILVAVEFKEEVRFGEAMRDASSVLLYLGLLVGRPQEFVKLRVRIKAEEEIPVFLDVVRTMPFHLNPANTGEKPHPGDVLLNAIDSPAEFSLVSKNWFARQPQWKNARMRFFNSYEEQRHYSVDRLVGSANMFDILPRDAFPAKIELREELRAARDDAQNSFRALPRSPERDSVLSALGRIGKPSLKQKTRHQLRKVTGALPNVFPDLQMVCDEAVNCRNYYVHGSLPTFDYGNNFDAVVFFAETLEFVFAASDLIESGWDIKKWIGKRPQHTHPFGRYRLSYSEQLKYLKSLLPDECD
jgi:hypothetical protein